MIDEQEQQKKEEERVRREAEILALLLLLKRADVTFRSDTGRFYYKDRIVSIKTIRGYLQRIEVRLASRLDTLVDELQQDGISLGAFQREFEDTVRTSHVLSGALAVGGIAVALRNADLQARLADELRYADTFVKQIRQKTAGSVARQKARIKQYMRAATITYGVLEQKARGAVGIQTECRRIRRASESCPGCIDWSGKWVAIAEMPPLGSLDCGGHCRCYLEYR